MSLKVNVEEGAAKKVESEKLKCSNKIPIDFQCPLKQLCKGAQPKTVDKLQEHLRLCHNQKKGAFVWPTAQGVKDGSYLKFLASLEMLFMREEKEMEPEYPSKSALFIHKKRGSIRMTMDNLENQDSNSDDYMPKSDSNSDGSLPDSLAEVG
jgi:hypothetical protein